MIIILETDDDNLDAVMELMKRTGKIYLSTEWDEVATQVTISSFIVKKDK